MHIHTITFYCSLLCCKMYQFSEFSYIKYSGLFFPLLRFSRLEIVKCEASPRSKESGEHKCFFLTVKCSISRKITQNFVEKLLMLIHVNLKPYCFFLLPRILRSSQWIEIEMVVGCKIWGIDKSGTNSMVLLCSILRTPPASWWLSPPPLPPPPSSFPTSWELCWIMCKHNVNTVVCKEEKYFSYENYRTKTQQLIFDLQAVNRQAL